MGLTKVNYIDNKTVIKAEQLNAMQDAIIQNEKKTPSPFTAEEAGTLKTVASFFAGITEADNGKVFRVQNGQAALVSLPSASGVSF